MEWVVLITTDFSCLPWRIAYRGNDIDNAIIIARILDLFAYPDADIKVIMVSYKLTNEELLKVYDHTMPIHWQSDIDFLKRS